MPSNSEDKQKPMEAMIPKMMEGIDMMAMMPKNGWRERRRGYDGNDVEDDEGGGMQKMMEKMESI